MTEGRTTPSPVKVKERLLLALLPTKTLNFKIKTEFKKEFKGFAVGQGFTAVELLKEGFDLSRRKRMQ